MLEPPDRQPPNSTPTARGPTGQDRERKVSEEVRIKALRMERAREHPFRLWRTLAHAGTLGWMFALPLVTFALLGHWAAQATRWRGLSLLGLLLGLVTGIAAAFRAIRRAIAEPDTADTHADDDSPEAP